jgi:hypothetical protein
LNDLRNGKRDSAEFWINAKALRALIKNKGKGFDLLSMTISEDIGNFAF